MPYKWSPAIAIQVPDLEKARAFYGGVLGMPVAEANGALMITKEPYQVYLDRQDRPEVWMELLVPDVAAAKAELLANGCTLYDVAREPDEVFVRDPFGHVFHLYAAPGSF